MVKHLNHLKDIGGENIAIGTDFDGVDGQFDIDSPLDMPLYLKP